RAAGPRRRPLRSGQRRGGAPAAHELARALVRAQRPEGRTGRSLRERGRRRSQAGEDLPGVSRAAALEAGVRVFTSELQRWGARRTLVGPTDRAQIARHVEDSLAGVDLLPEGAAIVDLGSGAGFPGFPIALARPDLRVTLVEIREKRIAFLRHAARELGLVLEVRAVSIEVPPPSPFDFALLRAVAKPERSLQLGRPWVKPTGEVWIWAGADAKLPATQHVTLTSGGNILRARAADFSRGTA